MSQGTNGLPSWNKLLGDAMSRPTDSYPLAVHLRLQNFASAGVRVPNPHIASSASPPSNCRRVCDCRDPLRLRPPLQPCQEWFLPVFLCPGQQRSKICSRWLRHLVRRPHPTHCCGKQRSMGAKIQAWGIACTFNPQHGNSVPATRSMSDVMPNPLLAASTAATLMPPLRW